MAIRTYTATMQGVVTLPRQCEFCGHLYAHSRLIQASGGGSNTYKAGAAYASAQIGLENLKAQLNGPYLGNTLGVLCPNCDRLSTGARTLHFPNGLREGILTRLEKILECQRTARGGCVLALLILVLSQLVAVTLSCAVLGFVDGHTLLAILALPVACAPVAGVIWLAARLRESRERRDRKRLTEVKAALEQLSDQQTWLLVKLAYKRSLDSLMLSSLFGASGCPRALDKKGRPMGPAMDAGLYNNGWSTPDMAEMEFHEKMATRHSMINTTQDPIKAVLKAVSEIVEGTGSVGAAAPAAPTPDPIPELTATDLPAFEITFICPSCHNRLETTADMAGKTIECLSCGHAQTVPARNRPGKTTKEHKHIPQNHTESRPAPDLNFDCRYCAQNIDAPPELFGERVNCPACSEEIQVPERSPVSSSEFFRNVKQAISQGTAAMRCEAYQKAWDGLVCVRCEACGYVSREHDSFLTGPTGRISSNLSCPSCRETWGALL